MLVILAPYYYDTNIRTFSSYFQAWCELFYEFFIHLITNYMNRKPEDILKTSREKRGWKQEDVSKKLGITLRQYQKYESGVFPKFKTQVVKKLDDLLGIKIHELIYEQKEQKTAANSPNIELLAAEDHKKFRGLVFARISLIEANIRALNNKVAEINKLVTGQTTTKTLTELEQTTREVAKMLQEELEKMLP